MSSVALIIPAAGSGSRLNQNIPKPYIELAGKPILEHTLDKFMNLEGLSRIVVATPADYMDHARRILDDLPINTETAVVEGGKERQHSIFNALQVVGVVDLIMVHDAVRPFVTSGQITACCTAAGETDGAVLGVPARDTIKQTDQNRFVRNTLPRRQLWQAQTPQVFKKEILIRAYEKAFSDGFVGTDDASLVERLGFSVRIVEGDHANFKITYPPDLRLAKILFEEQQQ